MCFVASSMFSECSRCGQVKSTVIGSASYGHAGICTVSTSIDNHEDCPYLAALQHGHDADRDHPHTKLGATMVRGHLFSQ